MRILTDDEWYKQLQVWRVVKIKDDPRGRYAVYRLPNNRPVQLIKPNFVKPEDRARELRAFAQQHGLPEPD